MVFPYRWMQRVEVLIISASSDFGVASNMKIFIFKGIKQSVKLEKELVNTCQHIIKDDYIQPLTIVRQMRPMQMQ